MAVGVIFFGVVFNVHSSFAQAPPAPDGFGLEPLAAAGLSRTDIRLIIAQIIRAVLGLLGIIALVLILYAGYLIMTSEGNEEKIADGKRILTNATIGLAIILSSFAIVQFIISALGRASGIISEEGGGSQAINTFAGSGALGRIIKDHYPFRGDRGVNRNTKISVTFREPIDAASVIEDSNQSGAFGDCVTPAGRLFNWDSDCDRLKKNAVQIFVAPENQRIAPALLDAHALTVPAERQVGSILTFVFHLAAPLGNDRAEVQHTVKLAGDIKKADGRASAFANERGGYYAWDFYTSTQFDYVPPAVSDLFPGRDEGGIQERVPRNAIVQIGFSEPVDPTTVQGPTSPTSDFTTIVFGDSAVRGEWKIVNGNRTVEFRPAEACGVNSCGETIYCLPRPDAGADARPETALIRTAVLIGLSGLEQFQAQPFTGVADMAGNALDGGRPSGRVPDGVSQGRPAIVNLHGVDTAELSADNHFWRFLIEDKIKRATPAVREVRPIIDQEDIPRRAPVSIIFSDRMWAATLDAVALEEFGLPGAGAIDPMWHSMRSKVENDRTVAEVYHREFGPNNEDAYYFPSIPSAVKNAYQNCLYPGRGPKRDSRNVPQTECRYAETDDGVLVSGTDLDCVPVTRRDAEDSGCLQTSRLGAWLQPNVDSCLGIMRDVSR